ncbi:MAG TPA: 6-carboxytetrahydropterin synthase [Phycisphaerales bacterium]|nr:6-carboxytetrahydropterin synthase [Phycisphaerales bacterium]HMP36808.1 6-carboxytetrahydropterin synthase [Phycisphaerales bacterium]
MLNSFAGTPSTAEWALRIEIDVAVQGLPDPVTGYLVDIGAIDRAVRSEVVAFLARPPAAAPAGVAAESPTPPPAKLLIHLLDRLPASLGAAVQWVELRQPPFLALRMTSPNRMNDARSGASDISALSHRVLLRQSFEFSASHRLHCPEYDDERNRALFGKCNNPNGHGHNYRLEVAVAVAVAIDGSIAPTLPAIERLVRELVVDRLDHTHLNLDVDVFRTLNPSVEHIARVCHDWLAAPMTAIGGSLRSVTLWETGKTSCEYPVACPA